MDELASYNEEYNSESSTIMQGARVTGDYETRRHVNMAIKMVYQLQADEENCSTYGGKSTHSTTSGFYHLQDVLHD